MLKKLSIVVLLIGLILEASFLIREASLGAAGNETGKQVQSEKNELDIGSGFRVNNSSTMGLTDFLDNFDSFDSSRWYQSTHKLGHTTFNPENISFDSGNLKIKIPANTLDGGEIESVNFYRYGSYRAKIQLPFAPSSITAFFMYSQPNYYNEIDIEIYNDNSRKIDFVTYAGGKRTHYVTKILPFDSTVDFHEYRFDFSPKSIKFYIDGQLYQSWRNGLTSKSMKLLASTWFPDWLSGTPPETDRYTSIDYIQASGTYNKNFKTCLKNTLFTLTKLADGFGSKGNPTFSPNRFF